MKENDDRLVYQKEQKEKKEQLEKKERKERKERKEQKKFFCFEKLLYGLTILSLVLLFFFQSIQFVPAFNKMIIKQQSREGTPIAKEEFLYKKGEITLCLADLKSSPQLKVLVNGEEKGFFSNNELTLELVDGDIVEVDASEVSENIKIYISKASTVISEEYSRKSFFIGNSVQKLFKFEIS